MISDTLGIGTKGDDVMLSETTHTSHRQLYIPWQSAVGSLSLPTAS